MDVVLDGEEVVKLKPVFGYLHRNHEQIAEKVSYLASMPYTDRLDYLAPLSNNVSYTMAVEKLFGITLPERGQAIRSAAQTYTGQRLKAKLGEGELQVRVEDNHLTPVTLSLLD